MRLAAAVLPICLCFAARAEMTKAQEAALEQVASAGISRARIPALSVAVSAGGGPIWTRAWGFSDLENHVVATPATVFRIASISKTFTATAAMTLVEKGQLYLDTQVQDYVPFPRKKWPVTTRQLLANQSGIRHHGPRDYGNTYHYSDVMESLTIFALEPLLFEPGTKYFYSSYGFTLAGAVVQRAAKSPYSTVVRDALMAPSGAESVRPDDPIAIIPFRARGYRLRKDGSLENCEYVDLSARLPGGGWVSNAEDLVRFARALVAGKLVKQSSLDAMWTRQKLANGELTGYGLGWNIADVDGVKVVQVSGGQQGANTHLLIAPDRGIAIAVLANLEDAGSPAIATEMLKTLLKEGGQ